MSDKSLFSDGKKSRLKAQGADTTSQLHKEQFQWGCDKRLREYRQVSIVNQPAVSAGQWMVIMKNNQHSAVTHADLQWNMWNLMHQQAGA